VKLIELRLRNMRCYKEEVSIRFDDLTALVGRNDSGKSTILDALDIFLNDGAPDSHDGCKQGDPKDLSIIGVFGDLPAQIVLDQDPKRRCPTNISLIRTGTSKYTKFLMVWWKNRNSRV